MSIIIHSLEQAITALKQDDIVAIPTETVYGLAGNAESEEAIAKIYTLKNRPRQHPLIMHVHKDWDLSQWVSFIPDYAHQLIQHFWPGPLTLVLPIKAGKVSPSITGGQQTVAIRSPQHPLTQELLESVQFPLVAPSANPFGKISPTTAEHVQQSFPDQPLLILNGGRCNIGIESTIIDATDPHYYRILRPGVIHEDTLAQVINVETTCENSSTMRVPGNLAQHYQPEKPLYCFSDASKMQSFLERCEETCYILSFTKDKHFLQQPGYQLPGDPAQLAYELYYQLRQADHSSANLLLIDLPKPEGAWQGIAERIVKASLKVDP